MSEPAQKASKMRQMLKPAALILLVFAAGLSLLVLWFAGVTIGGSDPLFRDKHESEWIKNLKYSDDEQVKEWRGYGEEGVQVLIRGLERANHPGQRAYRQLYRSLPGFLMRWVPSPKSDSTRSTRMCLASLLSSLGNDASNAMPVLIRTVVHDEAADVRQCAINFFTASEDDQCLLNHMPVDEKMKLLPGLLRALQDRSNWGLRNNAANALQWFPEQRGIVAPALVAALRDPQPQVRVLTAQALIRVDPGMAKKMGAAGVLTAISKDPDDQVAFRAVAAMKYFGSDPQSVVPALIESLKNTNTLVACEAVWVLEWAPPEFKSCRDAVVPALHKAAQRTDNVGGYARAALKRWESAADPAKGGR